MTGVQIACIVFMVAAVIVTFRLGLRYGRRLELLSVYRYAGTERYANCRPVAQFAVMLLEEKHRHG